MLKNELVVIYALLIIYSLSSNHLSDHDATKENMKSEKLKPFCLSLIPVAILSFLFACQDEPNYRFKSVGIEVSDTDQNTKVSNSDLKIDEGDFNLDLGHFFEDLFLGADMFDHANPDSDQKLAFSDHGIDQNMLDGFSQMQMTKIQLNLQILYWNRLTLPTLSMASQYQQETAPAIQVELLKANGDLFLSTFADQNGKIQFDDLPLGSFSKIRLIAHFSLNLNLQTYEAQVRNLNRQIYSYEQEMNWQDISGTAYDLSIEIPKDHSMSASAHILKQASLGFEKIAIFSDKVAPLLKFVWAKNHEMACGSCYQSHSIYLGGGMDDPDEYDEAVILHEMGHYFIDVWSDDDSPGGSHRLRKVEPTLAYGEGIAYFWAGYVANSPIIYDEMLMDPWVVDMENLTLRAEPIDLSIDGMGLNGRYREELVSGILWDLYDGDRQIESRQMGLVAQESFDLISMDDHDFFSTLINRFPLTYVDIGARGIDLSDLIFALSCDHAPWREQEMSALLSAYAFPYEQDQILASSFMSNPFHPDSLAHQSCSLKGTSRWERVKDRLLLRFSDQEWMKWQAEIENILVDGLSIDLIEWLGWHKPLKQIGQGICRFQIDEIKRIGNETEMSCVIDLPKIESSEVPIFLFMDGSLLHTLVGSWSDQL